MSVAIEFPGTARHNVLTGSLTGTQVVALPTPGSNVLQYVSLVTVDLLNGANAATYSFAVNNVAGSTAPTHYISKNANQGASYILAFPIAFPANANATAITVSIGLGGNTENIALNIYGYDVPV